MPNNAEKSVRLQPDAPQAIKATSASSQIMALKNLLGFVVSTAELAKRYITKLLIFCFFSALFIFYIASYSFSAGYLALFLIGIFLFLPSSFLVFLYLRLDSVTKLPSEIAEVKENAIELQDRLKVFNINDSFDSFSIENNIPLRKRLSLLRLSLPLLLNLKNHLEGVIRPDILFTVVSVANPAFALMISLAVVPAIFLLLLDFIALLLALTF